ncbi:MAG: zinc ribbon domain-containing protein [Acidobacteriota bacterium]
MYCPQCGQLQVADTIRFCSRCGFPLEGVSLVVSSGGQVPTRYVQPGKQPLSPRSKGVRQGAMLMLSTLLVVPLVAIISVNMLLNPEVVIPLAAILCFVGGLLRILYALIMEDAVPQAETDQISGYGASPQLDRSAHHAALPPASAGAATGWRPRPNTAEIYQPPSITENTTRLLDKDDPNTR